MKQLFTIALFVFAFSASAQLTLSEKATLAQQETFRQRIYQAMFAKASSYNSQPAVNPQSAVTTSNNLARQKQKIFALAFSKGQVSFDLKVATHVWLANYNSAQILDSNGQPIDTQINTAALDVVFDLLAGVLPGDNLLPPQ
jgi:hypothetical protein